MMKNPKAVTVLTLLFIFLATAPVAQVTKFRYVEDFFTSEYRNEQPTTAWWDVSSGEIKLFPFEPTLTGSYDTPANAHGIYVSGNLAFVADLSSGLQIISIINPASPLLTGSYNTTGLARNVFVAGDHAFVADNNGGLLVLDISNPAAPTLTGTCVTPSFAWNVYVSGDYAFVADRDSGLQVIDISDPALPSLVGNRDTPGYANGVAISGDYAYVADGGYGLHVMGISNPASPALLGTYNTPGDALDVVVSGDHAFVADGYTGGLLVIDISNPTSPVLAGSYNTPGSATGVSVSGDRAFVADWGSGFHVIDISNPTTPTLVGSYDTPSHAYDVCVSGDQAFVANDVDGLQVIEISQLTNPPIHTGYRNTPGSAQGVCVAGDHAFVADGSFGLRVIDITNPASPTLTGNYDTPYTAYGVDVEGDYAFVADYEELQIIDITNPAAPTLTSSYNTGTAIRGIDVEGNHAFLADGYTGGLTVIDISNPAAPVLAGSYHTIGSAGNVAVSGDLAFVADHGYGLQVIDITDPSNPTLVGSYEMSLVLYDIAVSGNFVYGADWHLGLVVLDVSDPTSPLHVASSGTPDHAVGVFVSGDHAFVADELSGLQVFDIRNPGVPTLLCSYDTPDVANNVFVAGHHAFVADKQSGLQIIQVYQDEIDAYNNIVMSKVIDESSETIVTARLVTTQTENVTWELSSNWFPPNWQEFTPDGNWNHFNTPGINLVWRSTHTWEPGLNPTASHLEIDWLFDIPVIVFADDVPNDQGGYVLLEWKPSGYDVDDQQTVTHYSVWRALHTVPSMMSEELDQFLCTPADIGVEFQGPAHRLEQGYYWEWLTNITAYYLDGYAFAAPTYYDSTGSDPGMHYFQVIAHTSDQWTYWISLVDSAYSVDNLAPSVPSGFQVDYNAGSNALSWDECPDEDFQHFSIYRGESEDFIPSSENLVHATIETSWLDAAGAWQHHYKISTTDDAGNESDATGPDVRTDAGDVPSVPTAFALYQNVPNPFNPVTTIRFDLPRRERVRLVVYDMSGRLVRVLADGAMEPGNRSVLWDGCNGIGLQVASGIYFYRLVAGDFVQTKKMVLLR